MNNTNRGAYQQWKWLAWLLLMPQLIVTVVFFIFPAISAIKESFYATSFWGNVSHFVGLNNYIELLIDSDYYFSIIISFIYSVSVSVLTMLLGLIFALSVNRILLGSNIYKTLLIWPYAIAPAVAGVVWVFLFNPAIGLLTDILNYFGLQMNYMTSALPAFALIVIGAVWQQTSYNFLFFLAGLKSIPHSLIQAAVLDGANGWQRFRDVIWPLLSPISFFLLIMNMVYSFFDTFGLISTSTQGGPYNSTNILVYKVYQDGFIGQQIGSSSAQSVVLMIIVTLLTIIQFRYIERKVKY